MAAVERGRRAAFAFGPSVHETVDWALPVLYVSEAVDPDYSPTPPDDSEAECNLADIIERLRVIRKPVFCTRFECLDLEYPKLVRGMPAVLALVGDTGFGKSRLLLEMAAQAVRDGHVPVLVGDDGPGWTPPATLDLVRSEFAKALRVTRKAFSLKPSSNSQLVALDPNARQAAGIALDPEVAELLGPEGAVTAEAVQRALQFDLEELAVQAQAEWPHVRKAKGRPLLLLDDFNQYPQTMLTSWFGSEGLGAFGLGEARSTLVPVVLAFSLQEGGGVVLRRIIEEGKSRTWLKVFPLQTFRSDGEDLLAYGRLLLNPNDLVPVPGLADRAWAFHPQPGDKVRRECEDELRFFLKRIPDDFRQIMFYFWVKKARDAGYLVEANDNDRLAQLTW
jgi:hypothetical protein